MSRMDGWPNMRLHSRLNWVGAFVAHFERGAGSVDATHEHAFARGLQPNLLLMLQRAHGGERAEMVVQPGDSHARDFR